MIDEINKHIVHAIVSAILMAVPKIYKPVVWVARELGLVKAISDNLIAKIAPKSVSDLVNKGIMVLAKNLKPIFKGAQNDFSLVIKNLDAGLKKELPPTIKKLAISPSLKDNRKNTEINEKEVMDNIQQSKSEVLSREFPYMQEAGPVAVHYDKTAQHAAESINANAFTIGNHIYFGKDQFNPKSNQGRRLLAHELTHVFQQKQHNPVPIIQCDYNTTNWQKLESPFKTVITNLKTWVMSRRSAIK